MNVPKQEIQQININGITINDPLKIANEFNEYFINQITKLVSHNTPINISSACNSIFMKPTTPNDILNVIKNLKSTNSTGYDDISTNLLKYVSTKLAPILSHIINICIPHGVFPEKLKFTIIKPIFKKGDRNEMTCYRPIALVPVLSKVF